MIGKLHMRVLWVLLSGLCIYAQDVTAKITYISADLVYVDAGSNSGVAVGDRFAFYRDGQWLANSEVISVSEKRSSCRIDARQNTLQLGDQAHLRKQVVREEPQTQETVPVTKSVKQSPSRERNTNRAIRGSISVQYYEFMDDTDNQRDFTQPGLRVSFRGEELWGGNYALRVRTRTRYTQRDQPFRTGSDDTVWYNRVYEASIQREAESSRISFGLGRIIPRGISGVGPLDGGQFNLHFGKSQLSILGGTQPTWQYSDVTTSIQKVGVAFQYSGWSAKHASPWQAAIAAVGEYTDGEINREYLHFNLGYRGNKLTVYQSAEVDINRDWREEATGKTTQWTNLYVSAQYRPTDRLNLGLSYDTRRNYRTYELITEDERFFDDLFRRGLRANVQMKLTATARIMASYGVRSKEGDDTDATSYYLNTYFGRFFVDGLTLNIRASGFDNGLTQGFNPSVRLGKRFHSGHSLAATYSYSSYEIQSTLEDRTNTWIGLEGSAYFGKHFFGNLQVEQNQGDESKGLKLFAEFGYRF